MASVRISALRKQFDSTAVLRGIDLHADDGEFVTLLGPSGCGKTTTLRCVAGLERPDGGEVYIGQDLVASPAHHVFVPPNRRDVGMVFQSYALWPHMSVFANVAYPLRMRRIPRRQVVTRVGEVLSSVGMETYAKRPVTDLSGGQQQRVALARALVGRPRVLLLDEPLSNLDAKLRLAMRKEIRDVHERVGTTSLYVTHDQTEAIALSDRVVVLHDGAIQQVGTPLEIHRHPANRFVAEFVGFENLLEATVTEVRSGMVAVALDGCPGGLWLGDAGTRSVRPVGSVGGGSRAVGDRVLVAVRAEHVRLRHGKTEPVEGAPLLEGTVSSRAYAGERWEYGVQLADRSLIARCPEDGEPLPAAGDTVRVQFSSERAVLLPQGDGREPALTGGDEEPEEVLTRMASPARR